MMFSETIRARTRRHVVGAETLVEMRLVSKTHYLHNGSGQLKSRGLDGEIESMEWTGLEGAGRISGLGASAIGMSRSVTMGLEDRKSVV